MQNPYMEALAQGGSVANQGMANASKMLDSVANIFNASGSLALKMNMLLEQEEARKQQELLQTAQLMHKIQQDEFMNKYRQNELNFRKENADRNYELAQQNQQLAENKFNLEKVNTENFALQHGGSYYDENGNLKTVPFEQSADYKTLIANNKTKLANKELEFKKGIFDKLSTLSSKVYREVTDKYGNKKIVMDPIAFKQYNEYRVLVGLSPIDIGQIKGNTLGSLASSNGITLGSLGSQDFFKNYINRINPQNSFNTLDAQALDMFNKNPYSVIPFVIQEPISEDGSLTPEQSVKLIQNIEPALLDKLSKYAPHSYQVLIDKTKQDISKLAEHYKATGQIEKLTELKSELKNRFGSYYNKLGFDEIINEGKEKAPKYLDTKTVLGESVLKDNLGNVNDLLGLSARWDSWIFGYPSDAIIRSANKTNTTYILSALTDDYVKNRGNLNTLATTVGLNNEKSSNIVYDVIDHNLFSADGVDYSIFPDNLQEDVKKINKTYSLMNGFSLSQNKSTIPSLVAKTFYGDKISKAKKKILSQLQNQIQKFKNKLAKTGYLKTVNKINDFLAKRTQDYINSGMDAKKAFTKAKEDMYKDFSKKDIERAYGIAILLNRAETIRQYTGE